MASKRRPVLISPYERNLRIQLAMDALVGNENFAVFIDYVREMRESSLKNCLSEQVLLSDRLTAASLGEVSAFDQIISSYDDLVTQRLQKADVENESH